MSESEKGNHGYKSVGDLQLTVKEQLVDGSSSLGIAAEQVRYTLMAYEKGITLGSFINPPVYLRHW